MITDRWRVSPTFVLRRNKAKEERWEAENRTLYLNHFSGQIIKVALPRLLYFVSLPTLRRKRLFSVVGDFNARLPFIQHWAQLEPNIMAAIRSLLLFGSELKLLWLTGWSHPEATAQTRDFCFSFMNNDWSKFLLTHSFVCIEFFQGASSRKNAASVEGRSTKQARPKPTNSACPG